MPGPSGLLYDDPSLSDFSDLVKPWGLRREDLRQPPPQPEQDWTATEFGAPQDQQGPPPPLDMGMGQQQNVDLTPSLPQFAGDPQMQQPQFELGSPHPDVNGEMYLPPVSAGPEVGSVTSFDAPRPFSEGFVGAPKAGSTGWDTLGRSVSDALGGAAYNALSFGGASSVPTSQNLLMKPGQLSSEQLHPLSRDAEATLGTQGLDSIANAQVPRYVPQSGPTPIDLSGYDDPYATTAPTDEEMTEAAPDNEASEGHPQSMANALDLGGSSPFSGLIPDAIRRPPRNLRNTGDEGVPTFGISDYGEVTPGTPGLSLNDADLARFVAENGSSGLSMPEAPPGFDVSGFKVNPMKGLEPASTEYEFAPHVSRPDVRAQQAFDLDQQAADKAVDRQEYLKGVQADLDAQNRAIEIGALKDAGFYDRNANGAAMAGVQQRTGDTILDDLSRREQSIKSDYNMDEATKAQKLAEIEAERRQTYQELKSGGSPLPTTSAGVTAAKRMTEPQARALASKVQALLGDPQWSTKSREQIAAEAHRQLGF